MTHRIQQPARLHPRLLRTTQQCFFDAGRIGHQCLVSFAHGREHTVEQLEQLLLGIAPANALLVGTRKGGRLLRRGKGGVQREQRRTFSVLRFARLARIRHDAGNEFLQLRTRNEERDGVVVALAHLAAIQPRQRAQALVHLHLRQHQRLAIQMVEALRHVTGDFQMLDLVGPHRHPVGTEGQNVGRHQHRIHIQARRHVGIQVQTGLAVPVVGRLVGVRAVEQPLGRHAGQVPAQLGNFGNIGLPVEGHPLRIQPCRQPAGSDFQCRALDAVGFRTLDQPMQIGQEEKAVHARIPAGLDGRPDGAGIVAQMGTAGGGDAGEDARQGGLGG